MAIYNPKFKQRAFHFTSKEIRDLAAGWIAIGIAFAILFEFSLGTLVASLVTVGLGFILHELAHKFVAQYYKAEAHFVASYPMLGLAILLSFVGFVFAAPGAVMIQGVRNKRQIGIIAAAGPVTNIALALLFLPIPGIGQFGFTINVWLALFNMIPFGPLDGAKILRWDKTWFYTIGGVAFVLFIAQMFI